MTDWYAQEFGECPHGYIKPYCGQCASDEAWAKREERSLKRERAARKGAEATVRDQSEALDGAYSHIRQLERRLRGN
jgi:hypothetical protein